MNLNDKIEARRRELSLEKEVLQQEEKERIRTIKVQISNRDVFKEGVNNIV